MGANRLDRMKGKDAAVQPRIITYTSGPVTVSAKDSGAVFTNAGAAGSVAFNLPAALKGLTFSFENGSHASDTIVVNCNGTEEIRIAGIGINGIATLAEEGEVMEIRCLIDGTWTCVRTVGTVALS